MTPSRQDEIAGLGFGLVGVVVFAMTLPMTRLAVGPESDPQLPPLFVVAGRAALAGLLSLVYLWVTRAPRPRVDAGGRARDLRRRHGGRLSALPRPRAAPGRCDARRRHHRRDAARHRDRRGDRTSASGRRRASGLCAVVGCALVVAYAAMQGGGGALGRRRPAAARDRLDLDRLCRRCAALVADAGRARDLLGPRAEPAADAAGDARDVAGAAGPRHGVERLRLRHGVLDVARLLRLVPRPRARRHRAREPGPAGAAVSLAAVRGAGARRAARAGDAALFARRDRDRVRRPVDARAAGAARR